tara:strand:+ start:725 stop:1006 length:282 start_codon:yes stop_codon:yes gene_type:complete
MAKKSYTLDDSVVSIIAKTLQIALLTGTDIVDNLRTIEIQNNGDGTFGITPNYNSQFEHWIAKMLEELEAHQSSENFTEEEFEKQEEVATLFE